VQNKEHAANNTRIKAGTASDLKGKLKIKKLRAGAPNKNQLKII